MLEIVTRGAVIKQHQEDESNNAITGNSNAFKSSAATFRVSAVRGFSQISLLPSYHTLILTVCPVNLVDDKQKGMTVVAIKFLRAPASDASSPSNHTSEANTYPSHDPENSKAPRSSTIAPHTTSKVAKARGPAAKSAPLRQVVTFRCRRLVRVAHDDPSLPISEVEEDEAYVYELPFAILSAQ